MSIIFTLVWTVIAVCMVLGIIGIIASSRDKKSVPLTFLSPAEYSDAVATATQRTYNLSCTEAREAAISRARAQWQ
jgi:hypothetical protein